MRIFAVGEHYVAVLEDQEKLKPHGDTKIQMPEGSVNVGGGASLYRVTSEPRDRSSVAGEGSLILASTSVPAARIGDVPHFFIHPDKVYATFEE